MAMTLNITVLTPTGIYQSSDFRLTDPDTGRLVTDKSAKTVGLQFQDWLGLVTYTGLGKWNNKDVSGYVSDWLAGRAALGFDDLAALLAVKGTELIDEVHRRTGRPHMRHTFVLAGFLLDKPAFAVISNFQGAKGSPRVQADVALTVTRGGLRAGSKAVVLITGRSSAVSLADRRLLQRVAREDPENGTRLRQRIEAVNRRAASASSAISPACAVATLWADDRAALQFSDGLDRPSSIPQLMHGVDLQKKMVEALAGVGIDMSNARLLQSTSVQSSSRPSATVLRVATCSFSIAVPSAGGYMVREIPSAAFEILGATALSDAGHIAGNGWLSDRSAPWNPWVWHQGAFTLLGYSGITCSVNALGDSRDHPRGPSRASRALVPGADS